MRIIERFDKYMNHKGLNDNAVTVKCGLSIGLLGKARRGDSDLGKKSIDKILKEFPDLNIVWLRTGFGDMLTDAAQQNTYINMKETDTDTVTLSREAWDVIRDQASALRQMMEEHAQLREELAAAQAERVPSVGRVGASVGVSQNPPPLTKRKQVISDYLRFNPIVKKIT